jgi:hypothetical protein
VKEEATKTTKYGTSRENDDDDDDDGMSEGVSDECSDSIVDVLDTQ